MSQHENHSITFKYIFPYTYNPLYVNGAQGGLTPRGELVANFYLERQPLPNEISHAISADGSIGEISAVEPQNLDSSLVRYVSCGIIMNYENARNLQQWLNERIAEMERQSQIRSEMAVGVPQG
jgi:hypothetical protein